MIRPSCNAGPDREIHPPAPVPSSATRRSSFYGELVLLAAQPALPVAIRLGQLDQPAGAPISARSCSPPLLLIVPGETPMTRLKARLNAASDR